VPARSILPLLAVVASATLAADSTKAVLPWSAPKSWDVEIAPRSEPGPRLVISGRVFGLDSLAMVHAKLYAYHADGEGRYTLTPHSFNRIAGVLLTNERGEYRIRTIVPGQYEGLGHVHVELWDGEKPIRTTFFSLYNSTNTPPVPGRRAVRYADKEFKVTMALLTLDSTGVYQCHKDLWMGDMAVADTRYKAFIDSLRHEVEAGRR
jgi:hypothetical protein